MRFGRPGPTIQLLQPDEVSGPWNHQAGIRKTPLPFARALQGNEVALPVPDQNGCAVCSRRGAPVPIAERCHHGIRPESPRPRTRHSKSCASQAALGITSPRRPPPKRRKYKGRSFLRPARWTVGDARDRAAQKAARPGRHPGRAFGGLRTCAFVSVETGGPAAEAVFVKRRNFSSFRKETQTVPVPAAG